MKNEVKLAENRIFFRFLSCAYIRISAVSIHPPLFRWLVPRYYLCAVNLKLLELWQRDQKTLRI